MKTALLLICLSLCSCSRDASTQTGGTNTAKLISTDETRRVAMHVLLNRYPKAEIVSESNDGPIWKYRFSTNGTTVPAVVIVDRTTAKAHFEKASR
jgi:nitrous oxide reductase accessory protein NosL